MEYTDDQRKIGELFLAHSVKRIADLKKRNVRFSHYTSASAALQIIEREEIWLRNAVLMNDFSEIQHGQTCILATWRDAAIGGVEGGRLHTLLERIEPGLTQRVANSFDSNAFHRNVQSFLISISEHGDGTTDEDRFGRLSMWRAYGGNTNVAFVFNNRPFGSQSNAYSAYTSPVLYCDIEVFKRTFEEFLEGVEREVEFLKQMGGEAVFNAMVVALHFAALSSKHLGFSEEREWRIIHSPSMMPSPRIRFDLEVINGVPQRVYKLPLKNFPEEGLTGATIAEVLEEIIIGPTISPWPIYEALASKLEEKGVADPWKKVRISDIPLRR